MRCGAYPECIFMLYNSMVLTRKQRGSSAHPLDVSVQLSDRHPPVPGLIEDVWRVFHGFPLVFFNSAFRRWLRIVSLDGVRCGACHETIVMVHNSVIPTRKHSGSMARLLDATLQLSDWRPPVPDRIEDILGDIPSILQFGLPAGRRGWLI